MRRRYDAGLRVIRHPSYRIHSNRGATGAVRNCIDGRIIQMRARLPLALYEFGGERASVAGQPRM